MSHNALASLLFTSRRYILSSIQVKTGNNSRNLTMFTVSDHIFIFWKPLRNHSARQASLSSTSRSPSWSPWRTTLNNSAGFIFVHCLDFLLFLSVRHRNDFYFRICCHGCCCLRLYLNVSYENWEKHLKHDLKPQQSLFKDLNDSTCRSWKSSRTGRFPAGSLWK